MLLPSGCNDCLTFLRLSKSIPAPLRGSRITTLSTRYRGLTANSQCGSDQSQGFMRDGQLLEKQEIDKMFVIFVSFRPTSTDIIRHTAVTYHVSSCKVATIASAQPPLLGRSRRSGRKSSYR